MTSIEKLYNETPWTIKEYAGFPVKYECLNVHQKELVDFLISLNYNEDKKSLIELLSRCEEAKLNITDSIDELNAAINQYITSKIKT